MVTSIVGGKGCDILVAFYCEMSYWTCFSLESPRNPLEEKKHLLHEFNSSTVVIHCVHYVNKYSYRKVVTEMWTSVKSL